MGKDCMRQLDKGLAVTPAVDQSYVNITHAQALLLIFDDALPVP